MGKRKQAKEESSDESSPRTVMKAKPDSRTSTDRKSALDSLVKRRRELAERTKYFDTPFESSDDTESSIEDNFVVSDSEESYASSEKSVRGRKRRSGGSDSDTDSSESSSDDSSDGSSNSSENDSVGFYARVSNLIDKKRDKLKTIADTMSPRKAFQLCMQYYAMCLVSRNCEYPKHSENKKLLRILPELQVAVRRIEREIMSRRDNIRPSYWKDEALLVRAIHRYPRMEKIDHRKYYKHKYDGEPCAACNRMGWSWEIRFRGDQYNSKGLWLGEIRDWLKAMDLPLIGKGKLGSEEDDGDSELDDEDTEVTDFVSRPIEVGTQCAANVEIYHTLNHAKNYFLRKIYDFIVSQKLDDSLTNVVRTFKNPKNHFVSNLYDKYNELIKLSESRFDADEDEGVVQNIKLSPRKKPKHSNRF